MGNTSPAQDRLTYTEQVAQRLCLETSPDSPYPLCRPEPADVVEEAESYLGWGKYSGYFSDKPDETIMLCRLMKGDEVLGNTANHEVELPSEIHQEYLRIARSMGSDLAANVAMVPSQLDIQQKLLALGLPIASRIPRRFTDKALDIRDHLLEIARLKGDGKTEEAEAAVEGLYEVTSTIKVVDDLQRLHHHQELCAIAEERYKKISSNGTVVNMAGDFIEDIFRLVKDYWGEILGVGAVGSAGIYVLWARLRAFKNTFKQERSKAKKEARTEGKGWRPHIVKPLIRAVGAFLKKIDPGPVSTYVPPPDPSLGPWSYPQTPDVAANINYEEIYAKTSDAIRAFRTAAERTYHDGQEDITPAANAVYVPRQTGGRYGNQYVEDLAIEAVNVFANERNAAAFTAILDSFTRWFVDERIATVSVMARVILDMRRDDPDREELLNRLIASAKAIQRDVQPVLTMVNTAREAFDAFKQSKLVSSSDQLLHLWRSTIDDGRGLSHDISSILFTLTGYLSLMRNLDDAALDEFLQAIANYNPAHLPSSLNLIRQLNTSRANESGKTVEMIFAEAPDLIIPEEMRFDLLRIINNFVSNSIKYADHNKDRPHVTVTTEEDGDVVRVTVEDNGVGIADLDAAFRGARLRQDLAEGQGHGLQSTAALVRRHDLKLTRESSVDIGSKFVLEMPRSKFKTAKPAGSGGAPSAGSGPATPVARGGGSGGGRGPSPIARHHVGRRGARARTRLRHAAIRRPGATMLGGGALFIAPSARPLTAVSPAFIPRVVR